VGWVVGWRPATARAALDHPPLPPPTVGRRPKLPNLRSQLLVHRPVERDDAAKRGDGVGAHREPVGLGQVVPRRDAARVRVLDHDARGGGQVAHARVGGVGVQVVVVRHFFAVVQGCCRRRDPSPPRLAQRVVPVERGRLVGVLPVAQRRGQRHRDRERRRGLAGGRRGERAPHPLRDDSIVRRRVLKRFPSEPLTEGQAAVGARGGEVGEEAPIVGRVHRDRDARVVFGRRPDHSRPPDVDILDGGGGGGGWGSGDGGAEGVEVDGQDVDRPDSRLFDCAHVRRVPPHREQAAVHGGVERLDAAVEHLREPGDRVDRGHRHARGGEGGRGAAGGQNLVAQRDEALGERVGGVVGGWRARRARARSALCLLPSLDRACARSTRPVLSETETRARLPDAAAAKGGGAAVGVAARAGSRSTPNRPPPAAPLTPSLTRGHRRRHRAASKGRGREDGRADGAWRARRRLGRANNGRRRAGAAQRGQRPRGAGGREGSHSVECEAVAEPARADTHNARPRPRMPGDDPAVLKAARVACHGARDAYRACADAAAPPPSAGEPLRVPPGCVQLRAAFEAACKKSWVGGREGERRVEGAARARALPNQRPLPLHHPRRCTTLTRCASRRPSSRARCRRASKRLPRPARRARSRASPLPGRRRRRRRHERLWG